MFYIQNKQSKMTFQFPFEQTNKNYFEKTMFRISILVLLEAISGKPSFS